MGSISGLGRCPGGGHGNPLWCSSLENPYGQRSLVAYSQQGHKESGITERLHTHSTNTVLGFSGGTSYKEPDASAADIKDTGSFPGLGRSSGGGHGNPLWCSCLENPMDRGVCQVIVHRIAKSWTRLKTLSTLLQA